MPPRIAATGVAGAGLGLAAAADSSTPIAGRQEPSSDSLLYLQHAIAIPIISCPTLTMMTMSHRSKPEQERD